jgi:hypothetical protein
MSHARGAASAQAERATTVLSPLLRAPAENLRAEPSELIARGRHG